MQAIKDTFYVMLRDRVAAANAGRTVLVRGVTRPGVLVVENELPSAWVPGDCFLVSWTDARVMLDGSVPLVGMTCSIRYGSDGDANSGGMDRGRLLGAMDKELGMALGGVRHVGLMDYSSGSGVRLGTNLFWGDVALGAAAMTGERLERVATVEVFGYVEVTA